MRSLRRLITAGALLLGLLVTTVVPIHAAEIVYSDDSASVYQAGFATLSSLIGDRMGSALQSEHRVDETTAHQETTGGLLYYDAVTNVPAFTDGWHHWALTNSGLVTWDGPDPVPPLPAPNNADVHSSVPDIILGASARYGVSGPNMLAVATCESQLNPGATGDHGTSWGTFQLRSPGLRDTFYAWGYHDAYSTSESADFVARWLSSGGTWGPWTCATRLGIR